MFLLERKLRLFVKIKNSIWPAGHKVWPPLIFILLVTYVILKALNEMRLHLPMA